MTKKWILPLLFFAGVSAVLNYIFFHGLKDTEFIFSGDQFIRFSYEETLAHSFSLRKALDLGTLNGWQFATQFWDVLFYLVIFKFGLSLKFIEEILFLLVLFISLTTSFLGFQKLGDKYSPHVKAYAYYAITFWYCFNPYTLELWHGGVYNLGSGLTYSLAPLIFYFFKEALFSQTNYKNILICALLLAIASFTFWLFAPLIFFLVIYFAISFFSKKIPLKILVKNSLVFLLAYLPLISFILFGIMHEYFNRGGDNNANFDPTFGNLQGGIWYQLLMLFSWGIYTIWTPRTLYPFSNYFFSAPYIVGIVCLYLLVLVGIILAFKQLRKTESLESRSHRKEILSLLAIFCLSVFFAKGAQAPLGEIFFYLYNHLPFFSVFRTSDIRFGFVIVLAISLLLITLTKFFRKKYFAPILIILSLLQTWPIFKGPGVRGENISDQYYDRIIHIPPDYQQLANFINLNTKGISYVLPLPAIEYGLFKLDDNEHLVGQDMLPKLVGSPFVYISSSGGMSEKAFTVLKSIISREAFSELSRFPIRYVVLRNDISCADCVFSIQKLLKSSSLVFENATFKLFQLTEYRSIIDSANVSFERLSPVKYKISFRHLTQAQPLSFLQSFNSNWKLFRAEVSEGDCKHSVLNVFSDTQECDEHPSLSSFFDFSHLSTPPIAEASHQLAFGYANGWILSPEEIRAKLEPNDIVINADGSLSFSLTLLYQPQVFYSFAGLLSLLSFIGMSVAIIILHIKARKKVV